MPRIRAGRRTNLGLLLVLLLAFGTGAVAFAVGTPGPARVVGVAHGAAGLALVLLVPWKQAIVRGGLTRASGRGAWPGIALALLLGLCLVGGVLHALGGFRTYVGLTAMQLHVGAALVAAPLVLWHVWTHRQRPRRTDLSRRSVLRGAALGAGGLAVWLGLEGIARATGLPGAGRRSTGSHEVGSGDPEQMPVTQWVSDDVPVVEADAWQLAVVASGAERTIGLAELAAVGDTVTAVLDCTGGWYAEQVWRGVRLDRLLPAGDGSRSIDVVSVTGYRRRLPRADATHLLLATQVGGQPLSAGHGAPLRLVAPGRRGFWWVKWVARLELTDEPWWWQSPYPLQ